MIKWTLGLSIGAWASVLGAASTIEEYDVQTVLDIPYVEADGVALDKQKLDLYLPKGLEDFPVMVFVHGGGLRQGDRSDSAHVGETFAAAGFGTAVIGYRLSPAVSHPAHARDAADAIAWVVRHIEEYGGDSEAVFVAGHSAGAYLAVLLALDDRYLSAHGILPTRFRGVLPISGFFHVDRVAPERDKSIWGTERDAWLTASPSRYARGNGPPLLFLYADGDAPERRLESKDMSQRLEEKGYEVVETREIQNRDHLDIWQRIGSPDDDTTAAMIAFMRERLD